MLNIDWDEVDETYNYVARDVNGEVWLYEKEPVLFEGVWDTVDGEYERLVRVRQSVTIRRRPT